jgi:uncharacterized membrane protein YkoI
LPSIAPMRWLLLGLVLAVATAPSGRTLAHDHDHHHAHDGDRGRHDHDEARRAVERGEIRPLAELLTKIRDKLPGEITGVEIERHDDRWLYEFLVVDKAGRLLEVYVDALSGDIRQTREK